MEKILALLTSRTNIVGILMAIAGVATFLGIDLPFAPADPEFQEKAVAALMGLGGFLAVVFRTIATKKVGGGTLE